MWKIFYHNQNYGSESQFNGLNVIFNIGYMSYGRLGTGSKIQNTFDDADKLLDSYLHPIRSIKESGGGYLFGEMVLPAIIPFHPNFMLHFIGEGMVSRKLEEYYLSEGLSPLYSKFLGITTVIIAQQLNEIVEQSSPVIPKADPVMDLFWNALGLILFQFDSVAKVFSNDNLKLFYWPGQAVIDMNFGTIYNQGEMYQLRANMGNWTSWKLAIHLGAPLAFGLGFSVPAWGVDKITWGVGLYSSVDDGSIKYETEKDIEDDIDGSQVNPFPGVKAVYTFHWDRKGSLMGFLAVDMNFKGVWLNIYPGVVPFKKIKMGFYLDLHSDRDSSVGVTFNFLPIISGVRF